MGFVEQGKLLS